jgi:hypothetical protein
MGGRGVYIGEMDFWEDHKAISFRLVKDGSYEGVESWGER